MSQCLTNPQQYASTQSMPLHSQPPRALMLSLLYMLPCCHHKVPHFCFFRFWKYENNLLAARDFFCYGFVWETREEQKRQLIVTFMTTTRVHSFIWIGKGAMNEKKTKQRILCVEHLCFIQFHPLTSNNANFPSSFCEVAECVEDETMPRQAQLSAQTRQQS